MNSHAETQIDLPIIDLSLLRPAQGDSKLVEVIQKMREACQEWGFFLVINHGVEPHLIHTIDSASRRLFKLPNEEKQRASFPNYFGGYMSRPAAFPCQESMAFPRLLLSDTVEKISEALWPNGNPDFCTTVREYSTRVEEVAITLMKLILLSLGLDASKHYKSELWEAHLRMNYYTPPDSPSSTLALKGHKDFSCLTILYQDDMGGLEVLAKEGKWAAVKPLRDSFAVNVGDSLEIWSNCRYRSIEHRVVYEGWQCRLSLAFFMHFADEADIYAPEDLVDEDNPRRYRAFTFKEFREYKRQVLQNYDSPNDSPDPFRLP
uniref:TSA: Wollemia nobilis Ref_Wollemi_Transcript_4406_1241 transcribed RNA sequence n=1 Tax=Wollemia nobilis TaxID=56998 RepID=A0A0C9QW95_9CONI